MAGHQIGAAAVPVLITACCDPPGGALLGCAAPPCPRQFAVVPELAVTPLVYAAARQRGSRLVAGEEPGGAVGEEEEQGRFVYQFVDTSPPDGGSFYWVTRRPS
jgi:hypothetical protein